MAAVDKLAGDRRSVGRSMWRRRALEVEVVDEHALLQEAGGKRWWLGRRWLAAGS